MQPRQNLVNNSNAAQTINTTASTSEGVFNPANFNTKAARVMTKPIMAENCFGVTSTGKDFEPKSLEILWLSLRRGLNLPQPNARIKKSAIKIVNSGHQEDTI